MKMNESKTGIEICLENFIKQFEIQLIIYFAMKEANRRWGV